MRKALRIVALAGLAAALAIVPGGFARPEVVESVPDRVRVPDHVVVG